MNYLKQSHLYYELDRKYKIQHFLSLTERGKEALWALATFLVCAVSISYFTAQFLLYITGYYQTQLAVILH